jgi:hypothetical protein
LPRRLDRRAFEADGLRRVRGFAQKLRGNPEIIDEALIFPRIPLGLLRKNLHADPD